MSKETSQWLNQNVLIGMTDQRGKAWHYRADDQGDEPNHYAGAIPVDDVLRRLFNWQALKVRSFYEFEGELRESERHTIVHSRTGHELGSFKNGYEPHQYDQWLLKNVSTFLDSDLIVSASGLLKEGAVAWVEVSLPETVTTTEGVEFRPNLVATTSFDGSLATTYALTITNVVCDNTLSAGLAGAHSKVKVRHSKRSIGRIQEVRDALGIVYDTADDFAREVKELTNTQFSDLDFQRLLDEAVPLPEKRPGKAETKREALLNLWLADERVAPWRGTALGALQAFNTYEHHLRPANKSTNVAERNMISALNGATDKADAEVLEKILELSA